MAIEMLAGGRQSDRCLLQAANDLASEKLARAGTLSASEKPAFCERSLSFRSPQQFEAPLDLESTITALESRPMASVVSSTICEKMVPALPGRVELTAWPADSEIRSSRRFCADARPI